MRADIAIMSRYLGGDDLEILLAHRHLQPVPHATGDLLAVCELETLQFGGKNIGRRRLDSVDKASIFVVGAIDGLVAVDVQPLDVLEQAVDSEHALSGLSHKVWAVSDGGNRVADGLCGRSIDKRFSISTTGAR
jgi:hypothetical protein